MDAGEFDPVRVRSLRAESLRKLDQRIIDAFVRAQANLGLTSRSEFARLMNQATGGHGPDTSTFNKWANGSVVPPAWALLLAAQVSGLTTDQLLDETPTVAAPSPEFMARLGRVEKQVERILPLAEEL